jgi:hypothetical protein
VVVSSSLLWAAAAVPAGFMAATVDRILILSARHLESALSSYTTGIDRIAHSVSHRWVPFPDDSSSPGAGSKWHDHLGGLIHQYTQVA